MQYSMQQTEQITNDPTQVGAKNTTTSNHPSTPSSIRPDHSHQIIALLLSSYNVILMNISAEK